MWLIILILILILVFLLYLYKLNQNYYILSLVKRVKTVDGTKLEDKIAVLPGITIFGNNFDLLQMNPVTVFNYLRKTVQITKGKSYIWYFLFRVSYSITTAEDSEQIFESTTLITKHILYDLVKPFLGDGLLISTDQKWHFRRKMLTPAFHFNVLQSFNEIFKEESLKLLNKLQKYGNSTIDVSDVIAEFTLNNVCETALGVKLENVSGSSEYRKIIHKIELLLVRRVCNPLMYYDTIYYLFGDYKKFMKHIKIAHDFSAKIINKRKEEHLANKNNLKDTKKNEFNSKKRYALLDTLLEEEDKGFIDHQGICDEVNTFMFEGYDTTATCLIFTILNLSLHPDVQQKCRDEMQNITDFSSMSVFDFKKLEYLECVLKETLRMYPSVPFIGRKCTTETILNGLIFPANTEISIHIYDIMRDPRHFPEPNVFKPERFLPEAANSRHPFAFVPFSAGSRNCIGQKFAILEMKAIMVAILKNFEVLPVTKLEDLTFCNGLVLRTQEKIMVKLRKISQ